MHEVVEDGRGEVGEAPGAVLAEVLPGVAVVFGDVPAELRPGLIDFGLIPAADRERIAAAVGQVGNFATVARTAFVNAQVSIGSAARRRPC